MSHLIYIIRKIRTASLLALASAMFSACSGDRVPDVVSDADCVHIVRLDSIMSAGVVPDSADIPAAQALLHIMGYGDQVSDSVMRAYAASPAVRVFTPDISRHLSDLSAAEVALGDLEVGIEHSLPSLGSHRYYAIVSPYNQSVYIYADTLVFVALNHYLGSDYAGYRGRFADYEAALKEPSRIGADVARALVLSCFPARYDADTPPALVSRMLYEGAVAVALETLMPSLTPAQRLGVTDGQWQQLQQQESKLWQALLGRQLLYSTSEADAARLLSAAPSSSVLYAGAPPMAGRFLGMRIVESYLRKHPDTKVNDLLTSNFYANDRTLALSGYNGRPD